MKILFSAPNEDLSICRYHEAFRGGLRRMFDTRFFGQGYAGYDPGVKSYKDILGRLFPNDSPDLVIIADINYTSKLKDLQLAYDDLDAAHCAKGLIVSDFWHITNNYLDGFVDWIEKHDIRYVLCQMPGCLEAFAHTRAADRFVLMPICIDPAMFNDWNLPKKYDIGFLGKGVLDNDRFYPERQAIHAKLNKMGLNYLTAQHPGYGRIPDDHPVGAKNFAYLINSCRIHVVTGSRYNNPFGKYFETMASNAMLMGTEPIWLVRNFARKSPARAIARPCVTTRGMRERVIYTTWFLQRSERARIRPSCILTNTRPMALI
jgi:hypothetical protein